MTKLIVCFVFLLVIFDSFHKSSAIATQVDFHSTGVSESLIQNSSAFNLQTAIQQSLQARVAPAYLLLS